MRRGRRQPDSGSSQDDRLRKQGTAVLLVEQLLEKALARADRVHGLVQRHMVLEADIGEDGCRTGWNAPVSAMTATHRLLLELSLACAATLPLQSQHKQPRH